MSKKKKHADHSTIKQHQHRGKTLTPPLATLPNLKPLSWLNDRLPEMLWATLLVTAIPRTEALVTFRSLADYVSKFSETASIYDVTHSGLSEITPEALAQLLEVIVASDVHRTALTPLLLFQELPAREVWSQVLKTNPSDYDWQTLMRAVALTLDHQSQEATDCRWVRLMCMVSTGKIVVPPEFVKEIAYYPNYGDMREVRSSIRATEIAFATPDGKSRDWAEKFWMQCLTDTPCFSLQFKEVSKLEIGTTLDRVKQVYDLLIEHCLQTLKTSTIDARHETVFGVGLYCLSIMQELLQVGARHSITGRLALRTIVEGLIALAYLANKDDEELWKTYRVFGAGQAKLAYLKLEEIEGELNFANVELLKRLANEDVWEEFLPIELGHWINLDTRKLSELAGVKDDYDRYFGWTSTFAHAHWGAVRDSVFDNCGNPLHRLHRIPRSSSRNLPDVVPDACVCTDKVLELVSRCYPDFPHRITVESS